jgi:hypothetical protein
MPNPLPGPPHRASHRGRGPTDGGPFLPSRKMSAISERQVALRSLGVRGVRSRGVYEPSPVRRDPDLRDRRPRRAAPPTTRRPPRTPRSKQICTWIPSRRRAPEAMWRPNPRAIQWRTPLWRYSKRTDKRGYESDAGGMGCIPGENDAHCKPADKEREQNASAIVVCSGEYETAPRSAFANASVRGAANALTSAGTNRTPAEWAASPAKTTRTANPADKQQEQGAAAVGAIGHATLGDR